jgi:hypothetical protein
LKGNWSLDESIKLRFDFGTASLVKPTRLKIGMFQKVVSKIKLSSIEFRRYALYYSQENYFSSGKYEFLHFESIDIDNLNSLFCEYVRSDEDLIAEYNNGKRVQEAESAEHLLKKYIRHLSSQSFSVLFAMLLQVSISDLWIESLKGMFNQEKATELKNISSVFNKLITNHPEYLTPGHAIKQLQEFDKFKDTFIEASTNVSLVISQIKIAEMWIPTRYLNKTFTDLISLGPNISDREQIICTILKPFEADFEKNLLQEWKESKLLIGKQEILEQNFEASRLRLYAPAITGFLTVLDFVLLGVADSIGLKKNYRKTNTKMIQEILTFIENEIINSMYLNNFMPGEEILVGKGFYVFQIETMLQYIKDAIYDDTSKHADRKSFLNRHGILHGRYSDYQTEINAKKVILLIDDLIRLHQIFLKKTGENVDEEKV